jgi:hypothetical protein
MTLVILILAVYPADGYDSILKAYMNTLIEQPPQGKVVWKPSVQQRIAYTTIAVTKAGSDLLSEMTKWKTAFVSKAEASEHP